MIVDIRALRYFVEVIQRQSYTDAARALFVTQPTVSKMIRQLEDELGTPVLLKHGRRLEPTDTGRVVLRRGAEIIALHAQLQAELADLARTAHGELALGIPPLASELLTPLLARYHQEYPNIELRLFERGSRTVEEELRAAEEADRRKKEEEERQRQLAANPPAQIEAGDSAAAEASAPTETAAPILEPAVADSRDPYAYTYGDLSEESIRIQPPSTGEPVPANSPTAEAAAQESPAPAATESTAEQVTQETAADAKNTSVADSDKTIEPATHNG